MVFPGGAVDNGDVAAAEALAGAADPAAVINVAACREAFEEAGVLIATNGAGNTAGPPLSAEACALWRRRVHDRDGGAAEFVKLCSEHGLRLPRGDGSLTPLCSFITPDAEHARLPKGGFDARFVLHCCDNPAALAPATADQSETFQLEWLSPMAALAASARGEIFLAPPQVSSTLPFTALSLAAAIEAITHGQAAKRGEDRCSKIPKDYQISVTCTQVDVSRFRNAVLPTMHKIWMGENLNG